MGECWSAAQLAAIKRNAAGDSGMTLRRCLAGWLICGRVVGVVIGAICGWWERASGRVRFVNLRAIESCRYTFGDEVARETACVAHCFLGQPDRIHLNPKAKDSATVNPTVKTRRCLFSRGDLAGGVNDSDSSLKLAGRGLWTFTTTVGPRNFQNCWQIDFDAVN